MGLWEDLRFAVRLLIKDKWFTLVAAVALQGGPAPVGGIPTVLTASIVGVMPNVRQRNVAEPDPDAIAYLHFRADPRANMTLLARSQGDPTAMTPLLSEEVRAIDADLPLFGIETMDQNLARQRWPFRVFGAMFAIGLTLGVAGAFGVGVLFSKADLLVQSTERDPVTIFSIATLLAVVAIAACVLPACRATQLDPLRALRLD